VSIVKRKFGTREFTVTAARLRKAAQLRLDLDWWAERFFPAPLWAEYDAKVAPLWAEYDAKVAPLWDEYDAKVAPLWAEYDAKVAELLIDLLGLARKPTPKRRRK
jgi:N-formylglutamate amidohydrolase